MKKASPLIFVAGFLVILLTGVFLSEKNALSRQLEATEKTKKILEKCLSSTDLGEFGEAMAKRLLQKVRGWSPDDRRIPGIIHEMRKEFPAHGMQVACVDRFENLIWTEPAGSETGGGSALTNRPQISQMNADNRTIHSVKNSHYQETFSFVMEYMNSRWLWPLGIRPPISRSVRNLKRPHLQPILLFDEKVEAGKIAGVLLVFDVSRFHPNFFYRSFLKKWRHKGWQVGFWDRIAETGFGKPKNLSGKTLAKLLIRFFRGDQPFVRWGGKNLVLIPSVGKLVLFGIVAPAPIVFPPWCLGMALLWCLFAWKWRVMGDRKPSLESFLSMAVGIAAGIPLVLTLVFWFFFEGNRVETMINDQFKKMEQHLVNIDNRVPEILRKRQNLLLNLSARLEKEPEHMPQILDKISTLEMTYRYFDHFWMISSAGVNLRDFSLLEPAFRRFLVVPRADRLKKLQMTVDKGFIPPKLAVELALALEPDPKQIQRYWLFKPTPEHGKTIPAGLAVLGKMIISRFNQMTGKVSDEPGKDKSDLVYGAVIDSQTGDLIQRGLATLGNFIHLGTGLHAAYVFANIIKDTTGLGHYFVMVFSDLRGIENAVLDAVFSNRHQWPKDLLFAAETSFGFASYPERPKKHQLRRFFSRLIPPRSLFSDLVFVGGKKMLLSGFACHNLAHYVLFAASPWEVIERQQSALRQKMAVLAGLMFLLLLGIFWRLRQGITIPAQALMAGVRAMETKNFEHRIPMLTGDEWDEIALSFNNALGGMKELEVARIVQTRILPPGPIAGKNCCFAGQSVMTGQVGGDYYDAIPGDDGSLNFVVGDVTGHGVSAALVVAMAKSAFHIIHRMGVRSPGEILSRMNRLILTHLSKKLSLSMHAGLIKPDGTLLLANAGHPFPFLLLPDGSIQRLVYTGFPLGTMAKAKYDDHLVPLNHQSWHLIMYTDGIIEQANASGEAFGLEKLQQAIAEVSSPDPAQLIDTIGRRLREFSRGKAWDDDVTVAVLSFKAESPT